MEGTGLWTVRGYVAQGKGLGMLRGAESLGASWNETEGLKAAVEVNGLEPHVVWCRESGIIGGWSGGWV